MRADLPPMPLSLSSLVTRFCVASLDYALVVVLAAIGSLWCMAVRLGFNSDPMRLTPDFEWWVVIATGFALFLFRRITRRYVWFAARREWRVLGAVTVVILGGIEFVQVRAVTLAMDDSSRSSGAMLILQGGVFLLLLIVLFMLRRKAMGRGWLSTASRAGLTVVLAGYLVYLGWDEPVAPSVVRNQAALAGRSEDEATYRLTVRYSPVPGGGQIFTAPTCNLDFGLQGEKRTAYLRTHRAEIEANWAELAEVRAWWAEMAAQPQLGDRITGGIVDQPIIRFQPVRAYMSHALAIAELSALDGDGDRALAMVAEVYVVGARLEPAARTLMRAMIARMVQGQSLKTAEFVLGHAKMSPEASARFVGLLAEPVGGGLGAKRLVLTDAATFFASAEGLTKIIGGGERFSGEGRLGFVARRATGILLAVTLNPQATVNRLHDYTEEIALLAEKREQAKMKGLPDRMNAELFGGFQAKNLSGRLLLPMALPYYEGMVKNYWETEDRRAALAKRLRESPPAT